MASDLHSTARKRAAQNEFSFERNGFPRSLDVLTGKETFGTGVISPLRDEDIGVYAMYGNRNRKWILVVGPQIYLDAMSQNPYCNWSKMRAFSVATNAVFFVGPDR